MEGWRGASCCSFTGRFHCVSLNSTEGLHLHGGLRNSLQINLIKGSWPFGRVWNPRLPVMKQERLSVLALALREVNR
jgi:hypothetical protein